MEMRSALRSAPPAPGSTVRRTYLITAAASLAVVIAGMVVVADGKVPAAEASIFRAINGLPGWLYGLAWPLQQIGALAAGPVVIVVALIVHRRRLAVAALLVTVGKLVGERIVKALVSRERPGTSIGAEVVTRGDVPLTGESFVSGHAVLVAALAGVITPYLSGRWRVVPWVVVAAVMLGRVYVGAHNPLDVVCGAALGTFLAAIVNLALRVPTHRAAS